MIIPIRCFTCGRVLANKWKQFKDMCLERRASAEESAASTVNDADTDIEKGVLDDLGIHAICCRTVLISSVDMSDQI